MPSVRYYDYGVMRHESDQRMLEAQRRSVQYTTPMYRVTPEWSEQARPAEGSQPIQPQDAPECRKCDDQKDLCEQEYRDTDECACEVRKEPESDRAKPMLKLSGEELLIAALLLLALSEGCEWPLVLTLLYLLM